MISGVYGHFYTVERLARKCVSWLDPHVKHIDRRLRVLEPSIGCGTWAMAAQDLWGAHVTGIDIDPLAPGLPIANVPMVGDFLNIDETQKYDVVIGNPPKSVANKELTLQCLEKSLKCAPVVGLLMHPTTLVSLKRRKFWEENPASRVIMISENPRYYVDGKTPSEGLLKGAFFIWDSNWQGYTEIEPRSWYDGPKYTPYGRP